MSVSVRTDPETKQVLNSDSDIPNPILSFFSHCNIQLCQISLYCMLWEGGNWEAWQKRNTVLYCTRRQRGMSAGIGGDSNWCRSLRYHTLWSPTCPGPSPIYLDPTTLMTYHYQGAPPPCWLKQWPRSTWLSMLPDQCLWCHKGCTKPGTLVLAMLIPINLGLSGLSKF